jgi:molybdopterin molybdotransferase
MGITRSPLTITTAVLHDNYLKTSTQRNFLMGRTFFDEGVLKVKLAEKQNPNIIHSTLNCNALIDVPANSAALQAGTRVKIFLLPSPRL